MDDLLPFLCGLSILLLIVMVLGHGMWVAAAWMFRVAGGSGDVGRPEQPATDPLGDELATTARQLSRLLDRGAITQQQYNDVRDAIQAELAPIGKSTAGSKLLPVLNEPAIDAAASGPGLVPAAGASEIIDAVLVEDVPPRTADAPISPLPVHPLDRPDAPAPPRDPVRPARPLADVLQSFMEESNIRWGEILAALLIVMCSVGLVISLRNTLKAIPYFPALLFTTFTLAFHGAGLYTLRRWKLHAVSRVILIISLLLVPLTFSGAIVMSGSGEAQRAASDPLFLITLAAGIGLFTWVSYSASHELLGRGAWPLSIGIVGCSASQVLIHRSDVSALDFWRLNGIAALPLACFLVASMWQLARARRWQQLSQQRVLKILLVLGTASFALAAALALLLFRNADRWSALAQLSPGLSIAAAAILALGLVIHGRTTARQLAGWKTAGTAIVVLGGGLLLMLVACAWPEPELLLAVGLINCLILAGLGILSGLPLLYAPAVACAALAVTIGLHLASGHFAEREQLSLKVVQAALMGRTGLAMTLLSGLTAAIGGWLARQRKRDDALILWASGGGLAFAAIAIAFLSGFVSVENWPQDRDLAAAMLLFYGAALIGAGPLTRWPSISTIPHGALREERIWHTVVGFGAFLLWAGLIQALLLNGTVRGWLATLGWLPVEPILVATIAQGLLTALLAVLAMGRAVTSSAQEFNDAQASPRGRFLAQPLAVGAAIWLALAAPFVIAVRGDQFSAHAAMTICAAVAWAALAAAQRWQWAISGVQAMAAIAPAVLTAGMWKSRHGGFDWFTAEGHLLDQSALFAAGSIVWSIIRRVTSPQQVLRDLLNARWPAVDQILLAVAAVSVPLIAAVAVMPHVAGELGIETIAPASTMAHAGRGWIALAIVVAALTISLWERVSWPAVAGLGIATFAAVWLAAELFVPSTAAASAARWAAAIYAMIWGALFIARDSLRATAKQLPFLRWDRFPIGAKHWFCAQPLLFGGLTILVITIAAVLQSAGGIAPHGPGPGTIFAAVGPTVSYAGPLLALVAVLLGYAVRERQAGFALGGSAVFQLAVNLAFMLHVSTSAATASSIRAIEWLQWNSIAAGVYALIWLALSRWITPPTAGERERKIGDALWTIQVVVGGIAATALVVWAAVLIAANPGAVPVEIRPLGNWLSYAAVGLVLLAIVWRSTGRLELRGSGDAVTWLSAGLVALIAATLSRYQASTPWIAFHSLQAGWFLVALAGCGLVCWQRISQITPHHFSVALLAALVVGLSIRGNFSDPAQPWWSLAGTLGCCGIAVALGLARRSQPYAFVSAALAGLAVVLFWFAPATWPWLSLLSSDSDSVRIAVLEFLVIAVVAVTAFWLRREVSAQQQWDQSFDPRRYMPRVHAAVALGLVPLHFLVRLIIAVGYPGPGALIGYDVSLVLATLALGGLLVASLWDRRAIWTMSLLYVWVGAVWCLAIGLAGGWLREPQARMVALFLAIAGHVALTGQVWSFGANLAAWGTRLGVSDPVGGLARTARWLPPLNLLLVAIMCVVDLAFVLILRERPLRVASALGPAIAAWGVLCLAQERRRDALQLTSLLVAGLSAIYLAWAQLDAIHTPELWLTRVFRLLMVLAALTFVYGLVLPRLLLTGGSWNAATRKAAYLAAAGAMATFVTTLALEMALFEPGRGAPVADPQVIAIGVVLLGLIAGLISMALLPGRDPLVLSESGRQGYVYAALATGALLFAHVYVCKPYWFDGVLRPYWPFFVMGLAFAGVGAAELFQRLRVTVLAEPLARTGSLLPLLPVIGWWVAGSQVDYALLLFIAGVLYLALSYTRKSWAAMVAAAMAGNGALWALLHDAEFRFLNNPQFWLIPPALSVLAAAQINRRRLAPELLVAIRYGATIVIYLSSTSEIFIHEFGANLATPMILLALSVAGVFAGIALRVQAFLFLGMTFTLLSLISMVAHASRSVQDDWPWWVFGIALGVSALVFLAVLEKKRPEITQLIDRLKQWEK